MNVLLTKYFSDFPIPEKFDESNCLICLEEFDLESEKKFISLPCGCSNCIYHIDCLVKWLDSGINKNYCVHCKRIFEIPNLTNTNPNKIIISNNTTNSNESNEQELEHLSRIRDRLQIEVNSQQQNNFETNISVNRINQMRLRIQLEQILQPIQINESETIQVQNISLRDIDDRIREQKNIIRFEYTFTKFAFHMFFNTIINLINVGYICGIKTDIGLRILGLLFFFKMFFNFVSGTKMTKCVETINFKLFLSFVGQFILIMTTILVLKNINFHSMLLFTQIGFIVIDLMVSAIISYYCSIKVQNVVYDIGILERETSNNSQIISS